MINDITTPPPHCHLPASFRIHAPTQATCSSSPTGCPAGFVGCYRLDFHGLFWDVVGLFLSVTPRSMPCRITIATNLKYTE